MMEKFFKHMETYMETYIELLTKGLKEYFIAIVDIEKNLADKFFAVREVFLVQFM